VNFNTYGLTKDHSKINFILKIVIDIKRAIEVNEITILILIDLKLLLLVTRQILT